MEPVEESWDGGGGVWQWCGLVSSDSGGPHIPASCIVHDYKSFAAIRLHKRKTCKEVIGAEQCSPFIRSTSWSHVDICR